MISSKNLKKKYLIFKQSRERKKKRQILKEIENTGYMNFSLRINSLQNDNLRVNLFPVVSEVLDIIGKEKRKVYKMRMGTT